MIVSASNGNTNPSNCWPCKSSSPAECYHSPQAPTPKSCFVEVSNHHVPHSHRPCVEAGPTITPPLPKIQRLWTNHSPPARHPLKKPPEPSPERDYSTKRMRGPWRFAPGHCRHRRAKQKGREELWRHGWRHLHPCLVGSRCLDGDGLCRFRH